MSAELNARLSQISKYSNIPSYAREIEAINAQLGAGKEAAFNDGLEAIEDFAELTEDLPEKFEAGEQVSYHVDFINGDDENTGFSSGAAFKTLAKFFEVMEPSAPNILRIYNGGEIAARIDFLYKGLNLYILGVGDRQKITFKDGGELRLYGSNNIRLANVEIENDNDTNCINTLMGETNVLLNRCLFTATQTAQDNNSAIFAGRTYLDFAGTIIDASAAGLVHEDAASGEDVSISKISANIPAL